MPRRPNSVAAAEECADTDALAAEVIVAHAADMARVLRDPEVIRRLREIIRAARGIQTRAIARRRQIEEEYPL